jgi:hypothetical protein
MRLKVMNTTGRELLNWPTGTNAGIAFVYFDLPVTRQPILWDALFSGVDAMIVGAPPQYQRLRTQRWS